jgi:hypothetical protein
MPLPEACVTLQARKEVIGMSMHHVPVADPHGRPVAPITRFGRWAVGLVATAWVVVGVGTLAAPPDSLWAWLVSIGGGASAVAAVVVVPMAIFRRGDRSIAVYTAGAVLLLGILVLLFHPLFASD